MRLTKTCFFAAITLLLMSNISVSASTCYVGAKGKDCPATASQKAEHKKGQKHPTKHGEKVHTNGVDSLGSVDTHDHSVALKKHKPGATTPVVAQSAGKKSKPVPPPTSTGKKSKSSSFSATTGGTVQGTASTTGKYSKSKLLKYHAAQDHSVVQIRSQAATRSAAATSVSYKYLDPSQNRLNQLHVEYLHQDHPEYFNPDGSLTDLARQAGYGVIINTGLTDNTDIQVTRPVLYFFKAGDGQQVTQVSPDSLQTQGLLLPNGLLSSDARQRGFLQVFGSPQNTRYFLTRNGQSQQLTDRQIRALQAGGQLGPDGTLTPSAIQHGFSAIVQQTPDPIVQPTPSPMQASSPNLVPGQATVQQVPQQVPDQVPTPTPGATPQQVPQIVTTSNVVTHSLLPTDAGQIAPLLTLPEPILGPSGGIDVIHRPHPDQHVELYHSVKATVHPYQEARKMKDGNFHFMVIGFREP